MELVRFTPSASQGFYRWHLDLPSDSVKLRPGRWVLMRKIFFEEN